jgi:hypothetical protein
MAERNPTLTDTAGEAPVKKEAPKTVSGQATVPKRTAEE